MPTWLNNVTKRIGAISVGSRQKEKAENARILADVKPENAFIFSTGEGSFTGRSAQNLSGLCEELKTVDLRSVEFHLYRKDFENWIRFLGDAALASQIAKIGDAPFDGERTRARLVDAIGKRIAHLLSS